MSCLQCDGKGTLLVDWVNAGDPDAETTKCVQCNGTGVNSIACIEACTGIDTAHLWPGAMVEMVEALHDALLRVDLLSRRVENIANKDVGEPREIARARAILAKLGKAGA